MAEQPGREQSASERGGPPGPAPFAMTDIIDALFVTADGRSVLAEDRNGKVYSFDLNGRANWALPEVRYSPSLSPDGKVLTGCSHDDRICFYDPASGKQFAAWPTAPIVHFQALSRDGKSLLAVCPAKVYFGDTNYTFYRWEYPSGKLLNKFVVKDTSIYDTTLLPDGRRVAWCDQKKVINVWDCDSGKPVLRVQEKVPGYRHLAVSPDGRYLATGGHGNRAYLWDAAIGKLVREFKCRNPDKTVDALAFSPDGKVLATGGCERRVYFWEVATGKLLARTHTDYKNIVVIAFFPDGTKVVTGHDSQSLHIWDARTGDELGPRYAGPPEEEAAPEPPPQPEPAEPEAAQEKQPRAEPPGKIWDSVLALLGIREKQTRAEPPPGFMSVGSPEAIVIIRRGKQDRLRKTARAVGLNSGVLGVLAAIQDGTAAAAAIANPSLDAQNKFDKLLASEEKATQEQQQSGRIADATKRELLQDADAYLAAIQVEDKFKGSLKAMLWKSLK